MTVYPLATRVVTKKTYGLAGAESQSHIEQQVPEFGFADVGGPSGIPSSWCPKSRANKAIVLGISDQVHLLVGDGQITHKTIFGVRAGSRAPASPGRARIALT